MTAQDELWNLVREIPRGKCTTYGELGRALHRPAFLPLPAFALKLLFGEMAEGTVLPSQRALPSRALAEGFAFRYPTVGEALAHSLTPS